MERSNKKVTVKTDSASMKVVVVNKDQAHIELEIEKHIKKIRSLIQKLRPPARQKYFQGLLSHIVSEHYDYTSPNQHTKLNFDIQPSRLTPDEMKLLEELSMKMEQLYRTLDHDPS